MSHSQARRGHALLWIFALSGFAGLVYQSIWTQYLGLFLGHSAHAQSLVLVLFMGGMALGAWLVSRHSESLRSPLLAYAAIELVIGVLGIAFDPLYRAATGWAYDGALQGTGPGLRWVIATGLVLPQCVLLGATFPLMSAGFMRLQPAAEGRVLAGLYFSNSIGAAFGAIAATYLLLPRVGLPGTILTAGLLNIVVAMATYPFGKAGSSSAAVPSAPPPAAVAATPALVLAVAALTGASSFVYEVTWVRMLSMALGTTLHAFELMLAAFIAGIAFGGLWLRGRADRLASPLRTAGWVQLWMGLAALASMFVYANAFEWVGWLMRVLSRSAEAYVAYNVASGVISLLVMFPAAFFAGMTLPLLTLALLRNGGGERAIGRVYAANTLGAIIGVLVAVHLLMPLLGLKLALWLAASVDLALGVVLLRMVAEPRSERTAQPGAWTAASLAIAGLATAMAFVSFDPRMLASSVYRHGTTSLGDARMLFYRDGKTASVAVYEQRRGEGTLRSIATNGKVDAGMIVGGNAHPGPDEYTMALLASLPLSMRDRFERVGVVGFGSGMTTHTLLGSPRVGQVDTVEIEPMMVEGARQFGDRVARAYADPRSRIVIDDAKSHFSSTATRYDLILSEPSNPWMGGTASLFSDEFYAFIPQHLTSDGLFVQWLQLYEIDEALVSSVLRAMLGHFDDVHAYLANGTDMLLVAVPRGQVPAPGSRVFADHGLREELARLGIRDVRDLQDGFLMDRRALMAFAGLHPAPVNSDYFPVLQLNAPAARFMGRSVNLAALQAAPWPVSRHLGHIAARTEMQPPPPQLRPLPLDAKQRAARELRRLMVHGPREPLVHAGGSAMRDAQALRSLGMTCRLDADPARSIELLASVAAETSAFLDQAAQVGLWWKPAWLACPPADPMLSQALALLSASAAGDHAGVIGHGQRLVDPPPASVVLASKDASRYFSGAVLFAALASGQSQVALEFGQKQWDRLPPATKSDPALQLLWTLAATEVAGGDRGDPLP